MSEDLRYPLGKFPGSLGQTHEQRRASIAVIAALPENLRSAVNGLSDQQVDTPYRDGGWTVRQVVHHIADSHINAYVRSRRALTEDWPTVNAYDENLWANLPDARTLPIVVSLHLLEALHRRWVALFESLSEEQWQRGYVHSENGRQKLAEVVQLYAWHSRHHVAHVTELRKRMAW
ncbi:YfiT family bacillithiol transferase [Alloacidobacterium sp.]|uniref:YfiT family bacillithiol transferase n=1 Tax=Alloacidobacterium sp. TaxID=2951999 RepID=UPI002D456AE0|nr:putative metal-dependent hydrolase [Alloacidobacterium sp.]HYK36271.1 putative metal-dependent hydrolase [Alloacidobacterium sp.]